jgi:hypothetical protein
MYFLISNIVFFVLPINMFSLPVHSGIFTFFNAIFIEKDKFILNKTKKESNK